MHVLHRQPQHRRLRQPHNRPRRAASRRRHILDQDIVKERCQPPHRLSRYRALRRRMWVVLRNQDRRLHVLHRDVLVRNVRHIVTPVAVCLDANPLVRALEVDALRVDVLRAARNLAADRQPMPVVEGAVRDGDVLARSVRPRRVDLAALDRNVVVARVGIHMVDHDVAGAERIDRIGIGRGIGRKHPDVADHNVVRVVRHNLPTRRVLHGHAFHANMLAVIEDHQPRPEDDLAHDACARRRARLGPPACAVAVNHAAARDGDVLGVVRAHQRLASWRAEDLDLRIIVVVGRAQQHSALLNLQRDIALQHHRPAQKRPAAQPYCPAARARASIHRRLDRLGVLGHPVRLCTIHPRIAELRGCNANTRRRRALRHHPHAHRRQQPHSNRNPHRISSRQNRAPEWYRNLPNPEPQPLFPGPCLFSSAPPTPSLIPTGGEPPPTTVIPTEGGVLCRRSGGPPAFRRCPCRCQFSAFACSLFVIPQRSGESLLAGWRVLVTGPCLPCRA